MCKNADNPSITTNMANVKNTHRGKNVNKINQSTTDPIDSDMCKNLFHNTSDNSENKNTSKNNKRQYCRGVILLTRMSKRKCPQTQIRRGVRHRTKRIFNGVNGLMSEDFAYFFLFFMATCVRFLIILCSFGRNAVAIVLKKKDLNVY